MKNVILISVISVILIGECAFGQQIFEDASGETTFYTNESSAGWVKFNSASSGFNAGYTYAALNPTISGWRFTAGSNLKVTAKDGIGTVLTGNQLNPGLSLSGILGAGNYDKIDDHNSYLTLYLRYTASYNSYKIINGVGSSSLESVDKNMWGHQLMVNGNLRINGGIDSLGDEHVYHFIGLSSGFKHADNSSTLTNVQIATPVASTTALVVTQTVSGKVGPFVPINSLALNFDYGILPKIFNQPLIGFNTYLRGEFFRKSRDVASISSMSSTNINAGAGLFFSKLNDPSSIVGGIAWQFNDLTNGGHSEKTALGRSTVFFYVGYTIP